MHIGHRADARGQLCPAGGLRHGLALPGDRCAQAQHIKAGDMGGAGGKQGAVLPGGFIEHVPQQPVRPPVIQLAEGWGDACLHGETAQQTGAEGMDGLDAQPARGFDGGGKQAPGPGQDRAQPGVWNAQVGEGLAQGVIGQHGPFPEPVEQAILHLCRSGFGVGQAQDGLRIGALQQQARHPVCQHTGLACARIGRQPGRNVGPGGAHLAGAGLIAHGCGFAHPTSSGSNGSDSVHSP